MPRRGRPTVEINLSAEERATLERWARRHSAEIGAGPRPAHISSRAVRWLNPGREKGSDPARARPPK
jgi:hypothetical protein